MALILVRATIHLPDDRQGRAVWPGKEFYADGDDRFVQTQLSVGHLVPVGRIPTLEATGDGDDQGDDAADGSA